MINVKHDKSYILTLTVAGVFLSGQHPYSLSLQEHPSWAGPLQIRYKLSYFITIFIPMALRDRTRNINLLMIIN